MSERGPLALCVVVACGLLAAAGLECADTHVRVIPAAASNPGLYGTHWSTDLSLVSRASDRTIIVRVSLLADAEGTESLTEVPVEIAPLAVVDIHDAVFELFGQHRAGALRLASEHPFEATSRTSNDGGGTGVHGEGIPAFDPNLIPWRPGMPHVLPSSRVDLLLLGAGNRPGEDGVRTNVGLVNTTHTASTVSLELYDPATGQWSEAISVEMGPFGWTQQDLFRLFGVEDREVDDTMVAVSGWAGVFPYLSRVSNLSGDGTYVAPVSREPQRTTPRTWEVTLSLSYSPGVRAYAFTYGNGISTTTVVGEPESGWSVTLTFESPATLCYSAYAEAGEGGGELVVTNDRTEDGVPGGHGYSRRWSDSAEPLWVEECVELD